jgi:hypothetical protein
MICLAAFLPGLKTESKEMLPHLAVTPLAEGETLDQTCRRKVGCRNEVIQTRFEESC